MHLILCSILSQPSATFTVPENVSEGPVLEVGIDYSKDRKNNYETETTNKWVSNWLVAWRKGDGR